MCQIQPLIMEKNSQMPFRLFLLAEGLTFVFVTLLQVVEFPLFLVVLLLMHTGIVLFIVSKKRFAKIGMVVKKYYLVEYLLLGLYLPILFYKILSYIFLYQVNEAWKLGLTLVISCVGILFSIINSIAFCRYLQSANHLKKIAS
jgi:hypothetical protein